MRWPMLAVLFLAPLLLGCINLSQQPYVGCWKAGEGTETMRIDLNADKTLAAYIATNKMGMLELVARGDWDVGSYGLIRTKMVNQLTGRETIVIMEYDNETNTLSNPLILNRSMTKVNCVYSENPSLVPN